MRKDKKTKNNLRCNSTKFKISILTHLVSTFHSSSGIRVISIVARLNRRQLPLKLHDTYRGTEILHCGELHYFQALPDYRVWVLVRAHCEPNIMPATLQNHLRTAW